MSLNITMAGKPLIEPVRILRHAGRVTLGSNASSFILQNDGVESIQAEVVLDYQQCEGGQPIFEITSASGHSLIEIAVVYSEGIEGIDHATGDGPFFLFSNAMDTYRSTTLKVPASTTSQTVRAVYAQRSQRYQKIVLTTPNSSITFSRIAFERIRPSASAKSTFTCSNSLLNRIWQDGVKTVDMCTVAKGETSSAWEVTKEGTKVRGQHWAPCRLGTRWADKKVRFQVQIGSGGVSWAVHMVANGLIFCLDATERVLYACEGLSTESTVFPVAEKGRWSIGNLNLNGWLNVETVTRGSTVTVSVQGRQFPLIENLDIRPILGGSANNTGSVAFGGPCQWIGLYRHLEVHDAEGKALYENALLLDDKERTLADFQVGTNALACTIDGAKRDRACFGGDLYVMGRSIAHSTMTFEAIAGSIELLTSHQTSDGYLGNLCPIQAPVHDSHEEPPTYAFYSLSYALLLVVAIKDYWLHTGDEKTRTRCLQPLKKLMTYTEQHVSQGVVIAPPPLSIFGASSALNNAYYEALQAMSILSTDAATTDKYLLQAHKLKANMRRHFYDPFTGIYHLDKSLPASGICQDVKAHAITLDLLPHHTDDLEHLTDPASDLPRAFRGLGHWDVANVTSPYATGFAVEALFSRDRGTEAVKLIERVWGPMADTTSPDYSGGHWEAMKPDGTPHGHDTSLMHGWSTWPVSLLPRYLAGLQPIEPGWKSFSIAPVLTGLTDIKCTLVTVAGTVGVELEIDEADGHGALKVLAPYGVRARLQSPQGWVIQGPEVVEGTGVWQKFFLSKASDDKDLDTKEAVPQTFVLPESPSRTGERQESSLPSKIRSLLSRFTAMRA
ncbi:glycoside hydrolase family 78 protein [Macroventuria anomochaeta]|uniref:Glycoside hydrolase family 78 protein n=1 Tax=Macroventuria anomochaeta TaxID=301207 RepID=A0ACB6RN85_9PLEO|nr:glycoside hydrolase family 78 protein [Macroventuria anomochaeta]KAF2623268.1 glycoside hydrolase family 78 protein [Macroventuria anomochaeta]